MIAAEPVVLDTVVLSNFAASRSVEVLTSLLPRPVTVPEVRRELKRGVAEGYAFTSRALEPLGSSVTIVEPPSESVQRFEQNVDAGEAAVLAVADDQNGIAASDDRPARTLADEAGIPVTGSIGILLHAIETDELTVTTADAWIERWIEVTGYYSPVDSIEELL